MSEQTPHRAVEKARDSYRSGYERCIAWLAAEIYAIIKDAE